MTHALGSNVGGDIGNPELEKKIGSGFGKGCFYDISDPYLSIPLFVGELLFWRSFP